MRCGTGERGRGFTLIELLVALGAASIVIAAATLLLVSQQHLAQGSAADRSLQETGRIALDEIAANVRLAGFGIDPALAFDFGAQAVVNMDRAPTGAAVSAASLACTSAVTCRDSTTGPDELVLAYRNPAFVRALAAAPPAGGASLTIAGPLRSPLYRNQVLQVICFGGSQRWAYVTVGQYVAPSANAQITVSLATAAGDQIPFQNGYLSDPCFQAVAPQGASPAAFAAAAKVYKVDRFRYHVASYDASGNVVASGTAGARPYLMLDQGLRDGSSNAVTTVVAPDVEDLQLAYVLPNSATAPTQLVGATTGTAISAGVGGIDLAPAGGSPAFSDAGGSARRTSQHPGNIRAVTISVVARSPEPDLRVPDASLPAAGNRDVRAGPPNYRRQLFETTAAVRNTDARAPFFPVYSTTGMDRFNVGGG